MKKQYLIMLNIRVQAAKTTFSGMGPRQNVIRFICECGQELIVGKKNYLKIPR